MNIYATREVPEHLCIDKGKRAPFRVGGKSYKGKEKSKENKKRKRYPVIVYEKLTGKTRRFDDAESAGAYYGLQPMTIRSYISKKEFYRDHKKFKMRWEHEVKK